MTKQIVLSVKSGGVSVKDLCDLRGALEREAAQIGVLITLEEPTAPMPTEAASAGFDESPAQPGKLYSRLQIRTVHDATTALQRIQAR